MPNLKESWTEAFAAKVPDSKTLWKNKSKKRTKSSKSPPKGKELRVILRTSYQTMRGKRTLSNVSDATKKGTLPKIVCKRSQNRVATSV